MKLIILILILHALQTVNAQTTVTFIELNDLHAHLTAHLEQVKGSNGEILLSNRGGLARIATKINQIRSANLNTILMNIGDTYHGGAEALFSNGNDIVTLVNMLNIDVGVPGNWDYAYGPTVTNARFGASPQSDVERPSFPVIAGNAIYRDPPGVTSPIAINAIRNTFNYTPGDPFLPATLLIEKSGIKIGMIGLTSDIVEKMHEFMAFNIEFTQGITNYNSLLQQYSQDLKNQGADLIIVMSELGIHKDKQLADAIPLGTIDVFFSAHTHEVTQQPLSSDSGALVVESGDDTWLGQMDISLDVNNQVTQINWQLHAITADITSDAVVLNSVNQIRSPYLQANPGITVPQVHPDNLPENMQNMFPQATPMTLKYSLDYILGQTSVAWTRKNSLESRFNNVFTDILKNWNQTDFAMTPGFRFDSPVVPDIDDFSGDPEEYNWRYEAGVTIKGDILVADAYRFIPAPFTVVQGEVSVARIKQVIESNLEAVFSQQEFQQAGGWFDGYSGFNMTVDLCQPAGQRLVHLEKADGTQLNDSDILSVTGCGRPFDQDATTTVCSYDGFENVTPLQNPDGTSGDLTAADFLIYALENNFHNSVSRRNSILDLNQTNQWPASSFVQPLNIICLADDLIFKNEFEG